MKNDWEEAVEEKIIRTETECYNTLTQLAASE
jgi:hypothetical protein